MAEDQNVVYVGNKPVMSYVLAIITHFNTPNAKEVVLKARGRAITTAVDVAEITRRRFMEKISERGWLGMRTRWGRAKGLHFCLSTSETEGRLGFQGSPFKIITKTK
jgi:DNA-binding protein Alba